MAFLEVVVMLVGNSAAVLENKKEIHMEAKNTPVKLKSEVMSKIVNTIQAIGVSALAGALPIIIY